MAAKRYWRLVGAATLGGVALELSELRLYEGGVVADTGATLTCTAAPSVGVLAYLYDDSTVDVVSWPITDYADSGWALNWDFGVGGGISSPVLRIGAGSGIGSWLVDATIQSSNDGATWTTFRTSFIGAVYPGENALNDLSTLAAVVTDAISYWPLDESSGSDVEDVIGSNSGTATGATVVVGKVGNARDFNGSSHKLNVPVTGFPTASITLCFWAKPVEAKATSILIEKPDTVSNKLNIHLPWVDNNIYWYFGDALSTGGLSASFNSGWFNQLAFWEFSAISGVGMKIYRNRVLLASSGTTSTFDPTGKTLDIAYYATGGTYWRGVLDEIVVFGRALTSTESDILYNTGAGVALVSTAVTPTAPTPRATEVVNTLAHLLPAGALPTSAAVGHMREHTFFDAYNGGVGNIIGTVKEKNTPANTPLHRRVLLVDEASRITIRETWSDPITGAFEFRGVKQGVKYSTISYDHLHNYRAVIADNQDAA